MLEAKNQRHNAEVISKKRFSFQNFVNFPENSNVIKEKNVFKIFVRKLSSVLQDETKLVMTLAHFQLVKK